MSEQQRIQVESVQKKVHQLWVCRLDFWFRVVPSQSRLSGRRLPFIGRERSPICFSEFLWVPESEVPTTCLSL